MIRKTASMLLVLGLVFQLCGITGEARAESYRLVVDPYHAYSYEEMLEDAQELQSKYPELIALDTIGQSVEGRDLLLITFGKGARNIFLNGSIHACEYISTTYLMFMIDQYANAYRNGGTYDGHDIKTLLDDVTFCIVPMVNPDGVNLVQNGIEAAEDPEEISDIFTGGGDWKANIRGVDLNRNFDNNWYVVRPANKPAPYGFKGYAPLSEPESKAVADYLNATMCWAFISFHTKGAGLYGWNDPNKAYYPELDSMVSRILDAGRYAKFTDTPDTDYGTFAGYARETFLKPTLTVELCRYIPASPYPDEEFDSVWEPAKSFCAIVAEEVLNMAPQEYLVFQNARFLHAFCARDYAEAFAEKWANSRVVHVNGGIEELQSAVSGVIQVEIDGKKTVFQVYEIGDYNYFKLRDLAAALSGTGAQFEVNFNASSNTVFLTGNQAYTPVGGELVAGAFAQCSAPLLSLASVYLDGVPVKADAFRFCDNNYYRLRDIARAVDFGVDYDAAAKTILIDTSAKYAD